MKRINNETDGWKATRGKQKCLTETSVREASGSQTLQFECFADSHFCGHIKQLAAERPNNEYEENIKPIRRHVKSSFTLGFTYSLAK
jgi:hypothetical protein